jgi:hypothetical protein
VSVIAARPYSAWDLGGYLFDRHRAARIAAATDWPYALCHVPAKTREIYERWQRPHRPLAEIAGWDADGPFCAAQADLLKLWRADAKRIA